MIATEPTRPRRAEALSLDEHEGARLLTALVRHAPDPRTAEAAGAVACDPGARSRLLAIAASHGVEGLAVGALLRAAEDRFPGAPELEDLRALRLVLRRRAAVFAFERDHILHVLRGAGFRPLVLKGAALAETIYDDPADRDLLDLDLLVPPDTLRGVVRALVALEYRLPPAPVVRTYRRHHFHIPLFQPGLPAVEVHWALDRADLPFRLDAEEIFKDATIARVPGESEFLMPSREHMLLHLVLQNIQEGFSRLSRTVDIDRLMRARGSVDWDRVVLLARDGRLDNALAVSLRLATTLLHTVVPPEVARALAPAPSAACHLALLDPEASLLSRRFFRSYADQQVLQLWLLPLWRLRLALLQDILMRDREMPSRKSRRGFFGRLAVVFKVLVRQAMLSARAAGSWPTAPGRAQMRFWSSQAKSSERL